MSRRTLLIIRLGVFAAACVFLYLRVIRDGLLEQARFGLRFDLGGVPWSTLIAVTGLMLLNWGVEAAKWRKLVAPVQRIGFPRAFAATIAGTSIALVTPNRTGEFAGRVLFLRPENRWQAGFATVLGSIAQFAITLIAGCAMIAIGGLSIADGSALPFTQRAIMSTALLIAAATAFLYFRPDVLKRLLASLPYLRKLEGRMNVLEGYGTGALLIVFLLSLVRYAVFTAQFCLLLAALAHTPFAAAVVTVPVVFLLTTLVPTTLFSELPVRGSIAASLIVGSSFGVLMATTALWLINLVLPAMIGSLILLVARIRARTDPA